MINSTSNETINSALRLYLSLGLDAIPLKPDDKKPLTNGWQNRPLNRLWKWVPARVNIGLRAGGPAQVAFIDCDDKNKPGTFSMVQRWLASLGYCFGDYPIISTASEVGRHIYIACKTELSGSVRKLASSFGAGEFRYGTGGYVVAPPSIVEGGKQYKLIAGDLMHIPHLELRDLLPILSSSEDHKHPKLKLSRKAVALLCGRNIDSYSSRSEAEQSLIVSLINSGASFDQVLSLFNHFPCAGRYSEIRANNSIKAARWLRFSYDEGKHFALTHESTAKQIARSALEWAVLAPWPGRTGAVDRMVFIAHTEIAYKAGRLKYAAASRDLAEIAGVSHMTATRATWRLFELGLVTLSQKAVADSANIYQLSTQNITLHSLTSPAVRKWNTLFVHDLFRHGGLGQSAGQVWQVLQEQSVTIDDLASITGRHPQTIKRVMDLMLNIVDPLTGECLAMVYQDENSLWHSLPTNLDFIARVYGVAGVADRQKMRHEKERRAHMRSLILGHRRSYDV